MAGNSKKYFGKINAKKAVAIILILLSLLILSLNFGKITYADASSGSSYCVIEAETGRILYSGNMHLRLPMASTTKVMTAYVVLKYADPLQIVKIPKQAVGIEGSSIYLREGEIFTVKELLFGLMLRSGNDSAVALAVATAGSVENFALLMNKEAKALGLANSNFTNPHGLDNPEHYTSSYDLAMITKAAFQNPIFKEIVGTKSVSIGEGESRRYLSNKNKILFQYEGGNGVKTGFTKKSGRCLVSSSTRGNMSVICVVLNRSDMFPASMAYMDNAYSEYEMRELVPAGVPLGECKITGGKCEDTPFQIKNSVLYPLKVGEVPDYFVKYNIGTLKAPVNADTNAGYIEVFMDNRLLKTEIIYTIEKVEKKSFAEELNDNLKKWWLK